MVLGKLPVPGRPTIWITVGQGLAALAVGAGGSCLDVFTLIYPFSPSLWETVRYRLKYCLKRVVQTKPTNQPYRLIHPYHLDESYASFSAFILLYLHRNSCKNGVDLDQIPRSVYIRGLIIK